MKVCRPPSVAALLGDPVEHSLSPSLHEAAFEALGLDARYVALRTLPGELPHLLRAFARSAGGNVTVPHKVATRSFLDRETEAVTATGACNCFWADEEGRLVGDNTDVGGFVSALDAWETGPDIRHGRVLLLGAGGGARAVAAACHEAGVRRLDVLNRTTSRARALADEFRGSSLPVQVLEREAGDSGPAGPYELAVNATTLGLDPGDPFPLDLDDIEVRAVFDLVYGEDGTPWTRDARDRGIPATDGSEMLVRQAGLSLERWFGVDPPLDAMRRALTSRPEVS